MNFQIPLCLWCSWTSDEATREFERSATICVKERGRMVSSPARASWGDDRHVTGMGISGRRTLSAVSAVSGLPPLTPWGDSIPPAMEQVHDIATVLSDNSNPASFREAMSKKSKRSSKRHGMIANSVRGFIVILCDARNSLLTFTASDIHPYPTQLTLLGIPR